MLNVRLVPSAAEAMPPQRGLHPLYRFCQRLHLTAAEVSQKGGVGGQTNCLPVLRELQRHGYDARVPPNDAYLARDHAAPADAARIVIAVGGQAERPDDARLIGQVVTATESDLDRLVDAERDLRLFLASPDRLTAKGRIALRDRTADGVLLEELQRGPADPLTILERGDIARLWLDGLLKRDVFFGKPALAYGEARSILDLVYTAFLIP